MAYDYASDVAFAVEMIAEFGRLVDFHKVSETPLDVNKPLEGNGADTDVSGVMACFVEPSSLRSLGLSLIVNGVWKDSTQIALVAADGVNDFTTFTTITDSDMTTWTIANADKFQPGDTAILYYVGVKR